MSISCHKPCLLETLFLPQRLQKVLSPGSGSLLSRNEHLDSMKDEFHMPKLSWGLGTLWVEWHLGTTEHIYHWTFCGNLVWLPLVSLCYLQKRMKELLETRMHCLKTFLPCSRWQKLIFCFKRIKSAKLKPKKKKGSIQSHFLPSLISSFPISLPLTNFFFHSQGKQFSIWHLAIFNHFPSG